MLKIHHHASIARHFLKHVGILFIFTALGMGNVGYINILTWLRDFRVKILRFLVSQFPKETYMQRKQH